MDATSGRDTDGSGRDLSGDAEARDSDTPAVPDTSTQTIADVERDTGSAIATDILDDSASDSLRDGCGAGGVPDGGILIDGTATKQYLSSGGILPNVAVLGCTVHLVWIGGTAVVYRKSQNMGGTWAPEMALADNKGIKNFGISPDIEVSKQRLLAVWVAEESSLKVFSRSSADGGDHWEPVQTVGEGESYAAAEGEGNRAFVIGVSGKGIWCSESADANSQWSKPVPVDSLGVGLFNQVAAASDGSRVHVVFWRLANSGVRDVLYTQSQDGCHDWSPPTTIAAPDDVGVSSFVGRPVPAIDVSGNRVSIIWSEAPSPEDPLHDTYIYYRDSHDLGATFGDVKRLETTSNDSFSMTSKDIASSGDVVHIVTSLGYFQSMDSGNTWSAVMPERAGNAIASDRGWTSIVGDERGSIFHIRF